MTAATAPTHPSEEPRTGGARPRLRVPAGPPLVATRDLVRHFGERTALDGVSLTVDPGEIHVLLGPNGAGKTTLLRVLCGLVSPSAGTARVMGLDSARASRASRGAVGLVPSGDRTFYMRLSGLENLLFFGRLHGMRRRDARARALQALADVGLADAGELAIGAYSHGMEKRLSLARALLTKPPVLLVDEATHDLDPTAAASVRDIVSGLAREGAAVLWATQRVDEIRGFADSVTLLRAGRVCFEGTVAALTATVEARHFVLRLRGAPPADRLATAVAGSGQIAPLATADDDHYLLRLEEGGVLGAAIAGLDAAGISVLGCYPERSDIEQAFVALSGDESR